MTPSTLKGLSFVTALFFYAVPALARQTTPAPQASATSPTAAQRLLDWSVVQQLPAGAELRVRLSEDSAVEGAFASADELRLTVADFVSQEHQVLLRADIVQVARLVKADAGKIKRQGAKVGTYVGLVAGVLTFMLGCDEGDCPEFYAPWIYPFLGAGVGRLAASASLLEVSLSEAVIYSTVPVPMPVKGAVPQMFATNARPHVSFGVSFTAVHKHPLVPADPVLGDSNIGMQVRLGVYETRRLKTEIEWTAGYAESASGWLIPPKYSARFGRMSVTELYQIPVASWWQPHVGVGVGRDADHIVTREVTSTGALAAPSSIRITTVHPFATAGFTLVQPSGLRPFLRAEVQVGGDRRLAWLTVGFDPDLF